jgi:hypothetical protein
MSDLSDTIKGFYSDFILRDLLSFVMPGAILTASLVLTLVNLDINTIPGLFYVVKIIGVVSIVIWVLLFGLFYIIGYGLQCFSYLISLKTNGKIDFLFPPIKYENKFRNQSKISTADDRDRKDKSGSYSEKFGLDEKCRNAKYYHYMRLPFLSHSNEAEKKIHERFIVLMQTSGNLSIAFLFSAIMILIKIFSQKEFNTTMISWIMICTFLSWILYFGFKDHRQKLLDWEFEVINYYQ